jgi:hypothetical protein
LFRIILEGMPRGLVVVVEVLELLLTHLEELLLAKVLVITGAKATIRAR